MATTQREEYVFTVKEGAEGSTPWIALEPLGKGVDLPGDGSLGFDLPKGTDIEQAKEIASYMNKNLSSLSLITFDEGD